MKEDAEGFLRPIIDESCCKECKLCEKSCPILNPLRKYRKVDVPIAALSKDIQVRQKSSSGGMFSIFAYEILRRGGVVFGVVMKDNISFHIEARNETELAPMLGSKYMQSDVRDTFRSVKKYLKEGLFVLYTGTPCQIAGLRSYLGRVDQEKLLTVDVVCHGAPSSVIFRAYLDKLALYKGFKKCSEFSFRELNGWGYSPSVKFAEGEFRKLSPDENLYMKLFLGNYLHRPSCYTCPYTTRERVSDITIADFWNIGAESPFKADPKYGVSLVLPNSEKGKIFYHSVEDKVYCEERTWSEALKVNHQLYRPSHRPSKREKAISMLLNDSYENTYHTFCDNPYLRLRRVVGNILRFLHLR